MNDFVATIADAPAVAEPAPLAGFELQAVVARGAAGVLYRGWDHALALPVAIKEFLPTGLAQRANGQVGAVDPAHLQAFERALRAFIAEARALARCDHPALVRVLQLVQANGTAYRVMPWYEGTPLLEVRRSMAGAPTEAALRSLIDPLLDALAVFHRIAGLHGAVTPGRILLLDDDRPLLLGPGSAGRAAARDGVEAAADFAALANVARFCITGTWPPEPVPEALRPRYGDALLRALDSAAVAARGEGPQSTAQFREWLGHGPPAPAPMPMPMPTAMPMPMPTPTPTAPAADETAEFIRRVVETVPPAPQPPVEPALDPPWARQDPIPFPEVRVDPRRPKAATSRRRRGLALAALAALLVVAGGIYLGRDTLQSWRVADLIAGAVDPAAPQAAPPPSPVPAPPTLQQSVPAPTPAPAAAPTPATAPVAEAPTPVPSPPKIEPKPPPSPPKATTAVPLAAAPTSPRAICGERTQFALYRCMQQQCQRAQWKNHAQCLHLRATDRVD